ncbi:MAG: ATP-binding protein [Okeania sp. SIO3I5]|uniref:sensor histidine kinase n=1 Tax=Okeania sp. SIO3I5 TaxID=2607805 RepID=UPI0013BCD1D2|nr:ATP-binding protein [Okeania sp. SIO3I5]NEQ37958.1 ATP-binding protein [Okeania sp. SIO3I5]
MFALYESKPDLFTVPNLEVKSQILSLESTIQELPLQDCLIESTCFGKDIAPVFEANLLLSGVILIDRQGKFVGMISRRLFFERMGSRYGIEMFYKRSIEALYQFSKVDVSILPGNTLIVEAAQKSLHRRPELLYDPIVVEVETNVYRLLDVHQLLVAQSKIHELTSHLLQKQTQAKAIQTEKMASLGRMIAEVAHEITNPVNCIWNNLIFLCSYLEEISKLLSTYDEVSDPSPIISQIKEQIEYDSLQEELAETTQSIRFGSEQLLKIVNSLRNFSHMDESKKKPANIHECIDSSLLILKNRLKYNIKVIKNYCTNLPRVNCYSGQLSQVFMNLISNSIDALNEKSAEIESLDWKPEIQITTEAILGKDYNLMSIKMADNGFGIPLEIQDKIFENFFTTKPVGQGTGMGLAISNQIINEKHGGKLKLNSSPGKGTEFEIILPIF